MLHLQTVDAAALHFGDLDGSDIRLDLPTLLELSREGRDAISGQRRPDVTLDADAVITAVHPYADGWIVTLNAGRTLTLTMARLIGHRYPGLWRIPPQPWPASLPVHGYQAFLTDAETRRQALLQLAAHGFVRLDGAPPSPGEIETAVAAFGYIRETNYGRIFDVRIRHDAANLADTALALAPHTDNPYRLSPPELQILHCLSAAGEGGQSLLVDGGAVINALKAEAPEDYALLCRVPARFAWTDGVTCLEAEAPVIALKADGSLDRIRYNPRSFQRLGTDDEAVAAAWTAACRRFSGMLEDPVVAVTFDMAPGDMVLMDNRRVLHGRTSFMPTGDVIRHLQGGYADIDGVYSTLRRLTDAHVATEVEALRALFESELLSEAYGEAISIRDHMLQSAEGATALRKGPELVAAALLHDIGWGRGGPHEVTAATQVAAVLGDNVAALIRNHVDAKRYLVAARPGYAARLSQASVDTLAQQGGPMTEAECRAFEALPEFEPSLELRYVDEGGKALAAPSSRFGDYAPLLRWLMIRHALTPSV